MENKEKILYNYFLQGSKKIAKIPKEKTHRRKLFKSIKTEYPVFMHPYIFGNMTDEESKVSGKLINIFKNNRVNRFRRFMLKVKGFLVNEIFC